MPEFEEENPNNSQSESYTPSTDASQKPRSRRRSGGFKNELTPVSNAKIGEVSAKEAIKEEKLSGKTKPETPKSERSEKPRREPKSREPKAERTARPKRDAPAPRTDANPQPSTETLAAIASVEAKIAERRAEKDARRAERNKNRPAKSAGNAADASSGGRSKQGSKGDRPTKGKRAAKKEPEPGLLGAIGGFFSKLLGNNEPAPAPKRGGGQKRSGGGSRSQSKGGGNRSRSGSKNRSSRGGGEGRRGSGKEPRRSSGRKSESAAS